MDLLLVCLVLGRMHILVVITPMVLVFRCVLAMALFIRVVAKTNYPSFKFSLVTSMPLFIMRLQSLLVLFGLMNGFVTYGVKKDKVASARHALSLILWNVVLWSDNFDCISAAVTSICLQTSVLVLFVLRLSPMGKLVTKLSETQSITTVSFLNRLMWISKDLILNRILGRNFVFH